MLPMHCGTNHVYQINLLSWWTTVSLCVVIMHVERLMILIMGRILIMFTYYLPAPFAHIGLVKAVLWSISIREQVATVDRHRCRIGVALLFEFAMRPH